jgi:hypothetical protein
MKKFFVITLATALCLALAMPAMAKVQAGGRVTLDWTYLSRDNERAQGGVTTAPSAVAATSNGFEQMDIALNLPLNRFNVKYTSDDGALGGFVELRGGGGSESTSTAWIYAWIDWQVTPTHKLTFGRQTTAFARVIFNQWVGHAANGAILGTGFGNVNHTTQKTGIKGYWRISDMFGLVWMLVDNKQANATGMAAFNTAIRGSLENKLPRIDLALPIRFPWGKIEPSLTWSTQDYDQAPVSGDDSVDTWGANLAFEGSWGMFSAGAEITYGQNLGAGSNRGAEGDVPVYYLSTPTTGVIEDGESFAWLIDLGFKFGPSKVNVMYGQIDYENDGLPGLTGSSDTLEYEYTRSMYGISWAIGVAKGFTIRPELMFFDFDNDAKIGGGTVNYGKEWILGLQFMLIF